MELIIGRVAKAHGITGEIVVDVRTDDPELRFAAGAALHAKNRAGQRRSYIIEAVRDHGSRLLLRLAGVTDRDTAEALRGTVFVIDSTELPAITEPDTYYDHQLAGLRVCTVAGEELGVVAEVLHTAAGELLAVRTADGAELLVPFVAAIVMSVSLTQCSIEIDPPEGLLDLRR